MKSILVLVGGSDRDPVVCETALAAAQPFSAHLEFLHVHVSPGAAARHSSAEFARGAALRNAMETLDTKAHAFSAQAADNIRNFCQRTNIAVTDSPRGAPGVTASIREETGEAIDVLTFHARHSDLVVMGRARQKQGLAPDTLERLVLNCGRPMLVAASDAPQQLTGTIMVCWKESVNAARAVSAATPLLAKAKRVVFATIRERDQNASDAVDHLARQFARHGVATQTHIVPAGKRKIPAQLAAAAAEVGADLVVMGAFGQSRARQLIFGSATEAFLGDADRPILLMH